MNYTLKVIQIIEETEDTRTICFKQPGLKKVKYLPGQYATLVFRINGRRYVRPYSFSSCPGIDDLLMITVKRVLNGIVSNHIVDNIKIGDVIEVMPAMGDFVLKYDPTISGIYLWGVGSGITPLISIAKHALSSCPDLKVFLIYGNRTNESVIFRNTIEGLQTQYQSRLVVKHFLTKYFVDNENPHVIEGRIDEAKALNIISKDDNLNSSRHFICGPAGLKESVKSALSLKQVSKEFVFSEDFELVKNPEDFADIQTRTIKLKFGATTYDLEVAKGKSILEAALDSNLELPYSCQTGNCSTCKAKLFSGQIKIIGLTEKRTDLNNDEFLTCCSHPFTDDVFIEI